MSYIISYAKDAVRRLLGRDQGSPRRKTHVSHQLEDDNLHFLIKHLGLFDSDWYLDFNPDVKASGQDALDHYLKTGWHEGRIPYSSFDVHAYQAITSSLEEQAKNPIINVIFHLKAGTLSHTDVARLYKSQLPGTFRIHHRYKQGVSICGYLRAEIGLGQAARNLTYSMDSCQIPLSLYDIPIPGLSSDIEFSSKCRAGIEHECALFVLPIESAPLIQLKRAAGRHTILYPYWELSRIPHACIKQLECCDEFWAPSTFISEMLKPLGKPVTLIPQPVKIPSQSSLIAYKRAGNILSVLTYFDVASYPARKNPMASIQAFQLAFKSEDDVRLIVKLRGDRPGSNIRRLLYLAAKHDSRIEIIDKTLGRIDIEKLVMECDVFLSLQRSEGFGFGPAEALAAAKPVITTCYGGVTDFINSDTAYPVGYNLVPVKHGEYPDWENQVWAEPNLDEAVEALQRIKANRDEAAIKGLTGRAWMITHHSIEAVGKLIRKNINFD